MLEVAQYTCYRTSSSMQIDGKLNEAAWALAPKSSRFVDIVTGEPAWFDTRVALLWDDVYLYFGFTAEETDVRATLTERDSKIYEENDLEIFIAGADASYEFEINALNVIYGIRPPKSKNDGPRRRRRPRARARRAMGISRLGLPGSQARRPCGWHA
jgi:Carbohydrate family 9 binding domain-like